jgi:hypothetical protein
MQQLRNAVVLNYLQDDGETRGELDSEVLHQHYCSSSCTSTNSFGRISSALGLLT